MRSSELYFVALLFIQYLFLGIFKDELNETESEKEN